MRVKTLASGSKGNCTILITNEAKIIIDMGISYLSLKKKLERNNLLITDFDGILITHSHTDHIKGLSSLTKNNNIPVFIPELMHKELRDYLYTDNIIYVGDTFNVKKISVELIYTSHDTASSVGYIISCNQKSLVYVTDTGYINRKYLSRMKEKNVYIIESNHDEEMLMDGSYPYYLKQRVVSDSGHLSNKTTAKYLKKLVGENTKTIILAHISEKNNTEELALEETKKLIKEDINIIAARQNEESPYIEV